ncbi:hypothetical protein ACH5RR_017808 [Cinchona calisaya]|uniref:Syntaxin N-terminal domain-containing protein n=1 Tax=Cinchona calisaya TaxID=153742 RepID=A0ABD2ZJM7_9GENT
MSGSFKKYTDLKNNNMETCNGGRISNDASHQLERFTHEIETIKEDMKTMEKLQNRLNKTNEECKTIQEDAAKMKELIALMDSDVDNILMLAKSVKKNIEGLELMSSNNTIDRTRISVVMGLGKKLRDMMDEFQGLRVKMAAVHKEIVEYKYYTITGQKQYLETIENLACNRDFEDYLSDAIEEHGRDRVLDFIQEIQERRHGSKKMQNNLVELHQIFLDVAVVVEEHGQKMHSNNVGSGENQVPHGNLFLKPTGVAQLLDQPEDHDLVAKRRATIALIVAVSFFVMIIVPLFVAESMRDME